MSYKIRDDLTPLEALISRTVHKLDRRYIDYLNVNHRELWPIEGRKEFRTKTARLLLSVFEQEFIAPEYMLTVAKEIRSLVANVDLFPNTTHLLSRGLGYLNWPMMLEYVNSVGLIPNKNYELVQRSEQMLDERTLIERALKEREDKAKAVKEKRKLAEVEQRRIAKELALEQEIRWRKYCELRLKAKPVRKEKVPIVLPSFIKKY